jgi:glycosyltransferase involved in cell wall biosynthesis
MQKYKVLLIGTILGSYRAQYIIDYLAQRNYDFSFIYFGKWMSVAGQSFIAKIYSGLVNKAIGLFYLLVLPSATHVFLLPMNEKFGWVYNLAHKMGKKTIMDFYSSRYVKWVDDNLQLDQQQIPQSKVERLRRYERRVVQHTDELIFLNRSDAEYYLAGIGFSKGEIPYHVMPLASPSRQKASLKGFQPPRDFFNLVWWGKAAKVHGIDLILEAAQLLQKQSINFHLYLLDIDKKRAQLLEESILRHNLEAVATVRFDLSFATGLESFLVENCDIALGSFGLTNLATIGLSNKIVDAISMGIPMVTMNTHAIEEFGFNHGLLTLCEPHPASICESVLELIEGDFDVDAYQQTALETHQRMFSPERFQQDLDQLFHVH